MIAGLLAYVAGFAVFFPDVVTVRDEAHYVRQAELYASGHTHEVRRDPLTLETRRMLPSQYPAGTALLMTPFVALLGRAGAYLLPLASLVGTVLLTAKWIEREGGSPLFALVILGFPATLVMGRVAMSDVPSMFLCALGLYAFWRGLDGSTSWWVAAGSLGGASLTLREPNVLIFAFFFFGAFLRRDRRIWSLAVGGMIGTGIRPLTSWLLMGDPLFVKASAGFGIAGLPDRAIFDLFALTVLIPGGLFAGISYRGRRWPELRTTVVVFFLFYLVYQYSGMQSGLAKSLVLGPRFFLPVLPLLALALSDVLPGLWKRAVEGSAWIRRQGYLAIRAWVLSVTLAAFAVHPTMAVWSASRSKIAGAIRGGLRPESVIVTNELATGTYLEGLDLRWEPLDAGRLLEDGVLERLLALHGDFTAILLDRRDSEFWRDRTEANEALARRLDEVGELREDLRWSDSARLRIWGVR